MSKLKPGMRARYIIFVVAVFGMFAYLTYGLVQLQLVQTEEYSETAESRRTKTIALRGKRGMITDADSVILANDEYIYNVTFYKDASSLTRAQYAVFSQSIVDTIEIIERNGSPPLRSMISMVSTMDWLNTAYCARVREDASL